MQEDQGAVMTSRPSDQAQSQREWAPGEAESTLRSQLSMLGLPLEDIERIVQDSLFSGNAGCLDVEDAW